MVDYSRLPHQHILCIDIKSFYASCAAVMEGLDPLRMLFDRRWGLGARRKCCSGGISEDEKRIRH